MNLTESDIIALVVSARSINQQQKARLLEMFGNPKHSDEYLATVLQRLADAELAVRQKENANLERIAAENQSILQAEEKSVTPQVEEINRVLDQEAAQVVQEYKQQAGELDRELDQVLETIQRSEHEADTIAQIRAKIVQKK